MKNIFQIICIVFLLLRITTLTLSAQPLAEEYDVMMGEHFPADGPGAAVIVAKGDDILYKKGFGKANMELGIDVTPNHVFEIGSITKQFTAVSILMLMEEGKLSLEDDITKYIKDYPTDGNNISIHHLLTHTSGIKSYTSMTSFRELAREDMKPLELIDVFKDEPMDFAPGEKWLYNNSGYIILGHIIEVASGISYEEFIQKKIFDRLGMKESYYGSQTRIIKNRASGYQQKDELVNADYLSLTLPYAAGSIMSTVGDLFKWKQSLRDHTLVSQESLILAVTDHPLNNGDNTDYGYGWGLNDVNGSATFEHSGGIFGYNSNGIYIPEKDVYIAILANSDFIGTGAISTKMAAMAIGNPYPDAGDKIEVDAGFLNSLVGTYKYEDGAIRSILIEEGKIYSQRQGSEKIALHPIDKNLYVFDERISQLELIPESDGGMKARFINRKTKTEGLRISKEINTREEVTVSEEILNTYAGKYELQPGFIITVSNEDGKLMTQATGQGEFQVFASSETRFYLKVVEAEIEFMKNDEGVVDSLILFQGGREMKAMKMND